MKANKFLTFLSVLSLLIAVTSCVNDNDYNLPNVTVQDPNITANTTFEGVISRYEQAVADGDQIAVFDEEQDVYIEGYVISSDQAGNFFEEIIIQNKTDSSSPAEDPRLGLRVEINTGSLSDTYEFGRKVYIKMNGLAIGESNGVFTIGKAEGNEVGQIQAYEYRDFVIRGSEVVGISPKIAAISEITEDDENTLIQLQDMQINRNQLALTYAGEPSDEFDGFRTLESCTEGSSITLQTSTFADFKSLQVPQLSGSITGILSRDFFDDISVFVINSAGDVDFADPRCDPDFLECTTSGTGNTDFYSENFEGFGGYVAEGWTNVNINGGGLEWIVGNFSGSSYAQISGFNSDENDIDVWLVTPAINMDGTTGENLSFDVQTNFNNGDILSVFITDAFTGDPTTTEWQILDLTIPSGSSSGFGTFAPVGPVNISCLDGDVHIGFLYSGSDPSATTRYHIDNIEVKGD